MARLPRLTVPGHVHHIIQRGNNGQAVFADDEDRQFMLALLAEHARDLGVAVHAYVLMSAHLHLLATPGSADGVGQLMQAVGRRYVRRFNDRTSRAGTLWEGRYRSTLIQAERYLLSAMAHLDLAPVRSGLAAAPADYLWSSHQHYAGRRTDRLVTPHAVYWALGDTPFAREAAYVEQVAAGVPLQLERALSDAALRGWALGDEQYLAALQQQTQRRAVPAKPGRPRKSNVSPILPA